MTELPDAAGPVDSPEDWARWERQFVEHRVRTWRAWLRKNYRDLTPEEREAVECYTDTAEAMGTAAAASAIRKYVLIALRFRRPDFGRDTEPERADEGAAHNPQPETDDNRDHEDRSE